MKLPEKEAYRLIDVANRWQCSEHDLIDFCTSRTLRLALYVRQDLEGITRERTSEGKHKPAYASIQGSYYTSFPEMLEVLSAFERNESVELAGWLPLCPVDLIDRLHRNPEEHDDYDLDDEEGNWLFKWEVTVPGTIQKSDLRITNAEIMRFEQIHKNQQQKVASISNEHRELSKREKTNLLKTIGVLTELLIDSRGPLFKRDGRPNINQVVQEIIRYLAREGIAPKGMSERALHNRVTESLEAIKKH